MWPYYPELLATPVPRYTSYPTAAEFDEIDASNYCTALEHAQGDISLYIHIPFCEKICFYCGCNTSAAGKRQRLESYLAALHREIETVGSLLGDRTRVRRISFGGGSPNAIAPDEFDALVAALVNAFNLTSPTYSIELDPRTMTSDWAEAIGRIGVERASLGVQTFATHCQTAIGREQSEGVIARTVDWLREAGVTSLNFDLMYGLPDQSRDDLVDSLRRSRSLGADRIALFGYAHVPHIIPRQRVIDTGSLPDARERFEMAANGHQVLTGEGYRVAGFDHYALPNDPIAKAVEASALRRNFQGFTDDQAETLIGLGASSISTFPDLHIQNEKNTGRYRMLLSQGQFAANRGVFRSQSDRQIGRIIEDILCARPVELSSNLISQVRGRIDPFIEGGLVKIEGNELSVKPAGQPYARSLASLFDRYRQLTPGRFSSAV